MEITEKVIEKITKVNPALAKEIEVKKKLLINEKIIKK